jgi:hypothetical protein
MSGWSFVMLFLCSYIIGGLTILETISIGGTTSLMEWDTQISKMCAAVNDVAEAISVKHPELAIGIAESSDSMAS